MGSMLKPDGGARARVNAAYRQNWMRVVLRDETGALQRIFGATKDELRSGAKNLPPGWETMGESIGRALYAGAVEDEDALRIVLDARARNISFGDIAAHFRKLRLGEKHGNCISLTLALSRALDNYQKQFPATTLQQRIGAVENLLDSVREESEEADHE
jgi:hypothetical protein